MPPGLHNAAFLEATLPTFKWLTLGDFCLGLTESFLYGAYAGLVFCPDLQLFHPPIWRCTNASTAISAKA